MIILFCILIINSLNARSKKYSNLSGKTNIPSDNSKTSFHYTKKDIINDVFKQSSGCTILTVNFVPNLPLLTINEYKSLDEFVIFAKMFDTLNIKIVGYSASISKGCDIEFSKKLSMERAQTVRNYLIKNGIEPYRIIISGSGSKNPVGDNNTKEGQSLNRRAELSFVINKQQ